MKQINNKEEFDKYLKKHNWLAPYRYCKRTIIFEVDNKEIARVDYDEIRKVSKYIIMNRKEVK